MTDHHRGQPGIEHPGPPLAEPSRGPRPSYPVADEEIPAKKTISWQMLAVIGLVVLVVVLMLALHMGGVIGHGHH